MKTESLQTQIRKETGTRTSARLRRQGRVPAVLYGHGGANVLLSVDMHDLSMVLQHGARMLELVIDKMTETVIAKDIQFDALGDEPIHVDFTRVAIDEKIRLLVTVELAGTAQGAEVGGILDHPTKEIEIECLPTQIPESIRINVRPMQIDDVITVGDLQIPEGVTVLTDPGQVAVIVHPPIKQVDEEEVSEEEAPAEPEVIGAKPEEVEEGSESDKS